MLRARWNADAEDRHQLSRFRNIRKHEPCRCEPAGLSLRSRREIMARQHGADVAQVDERVLPLGRAVRKVWQGVGDPDPQIDQFDPRQAQQLVYVSTRIVSSIVFGRANRGLLVEAPCSGGGGCIACDRQRAIASLRATATIMIFRIRVL